MTLPFSPLDFEGLGLEIARLQASIEGRERVISDGLSQSAYSDGYADQLITDMEAVVGASRLLLAELLSLTRTVVRAQAAALDGARGPRPHNPTSPAA